MSKIPETILCWRDVWTYWLHFLRSLEPWLSYSVTLTILLAECSLMGVFNSDRSASKDHPKNVKATAVYTPLTSAIGYRWSSLTKRQTKEVNPALYFAILGGWFSLSVNLFTIITAIWKFESLHDALPWDINHTDELESISNTLISKADVNKQVLTRESRQLIE